MEHIIGTIYICAALRLSIPLTKRGSLLKKKHWRSSMFHDRYSDTTV